MPVAGGGFEQCYNAQAAVAAGSLLVVATDVVQAPNDKQQLEPMVGKLAALPEALGAPQTLLADSGYFSAANVEACTAAGIEPLIALGPAVPSSVLARALRRRTAGAGQSDPGRGHGPPPGDARGQEALRPAQADARTGVRHHQVGARLPPVPAARARQGPRRVEPRHPGLEHQAHVRPESRSASPRIAPSCAIRALPTSQLPSGQHTQNADRSPVRLLQPPTRCRASPANLQSDRLLRDGGVMGNGTP